MPGGIGAVVYFLLRQPLLSRCPHCSTEIAASYHFCPQCQFQMAPVCGQCFRGVEITDVYCKQCGHDLEQDHACRRGCGLSGISGVPCAIFRGVDLNFGSKNCMHGVEGVLIVDDEPLARQELQYLLEAAGDVEVHWRWGQRDRGRGADPDP